MQAGEEPVHILMLPPPCFCVRVVLVQVLLTRVSEAVYRSTEDRIQGQVQVCQSSEDYVGLDPDEQQVAAEHLG